ncbi:MAG: hypothetical protein A4E56_00136 [Pelotomaculum sp. PtaU1.Bin065]|nr:MAG: hypothetical protein A4E56_00136 [Pelotomaculum sp. PtaU1.Bin065]
MDLEDSQQVEQYQEQDEVQSAGQVETKYPRRELMVNAQAAFGVMPEVVAGALHGNNAEELTINEVKAAIKDFLERKVV